MAEPKYSRSWERACQHLARTLRAFHDRLADHVRAALGVSLTPPEFTLEVFDEWVVNFLSRP
jgi:hypothetical protein